MLPSFVDFAVFSLQRLLDRYPKTGGLKLNLFNCRTGHPKSFCNLSRQSSHECLKPAASFRTRLASIAINVIYEQSERNFMLVKELLARFQTKAEKGEKDEREFLISGLSE